ncbi:MAG: putative DNA binding domain-containing protein [Alkalinema sp. CAN_BIN05]|nr:putative DNA binding domain-containing protein [Alkalinema sp. CAN_BIN05]
MSVIERLEIEEWAEGLDVEIKLAAGRDGRGELPKDFFESYVAMANTVGGCIFLGIKELSGRFEVVGIQDVAKVQKELWDNLNNRQKVNINLLTDSMVTVVADEQGRQVIKVRVPRAKRTERPIYIGQNPLKGTYRRNYEGDYLCDDEMVRRMLAEQVEESRDARLLEGFGFDDVELSTLSAYRNQFKSSKPSHPWLELDDQEFLRSIGGWGRDRQTGAQGLTIAGLLMFGKLPSILEALPNYVVDYQERPRSVAEARWVDRVTTDGSWSGNLYDFYRRVILKLVADLKVPFKLMGTDRVDDTPVHETLREALVNTLIHGDYTGRVSVLVVKQPDLFEFRNPGLMRLSLEEVKQGGISDCRNRNLQKMFQLVGLGEQAGSGISKIYSNWKALNWRSPEFQERLEPSEHVVLALKMVGLLPDETVRELDRRFGDRFQGLSSEKKLALATVVNEGLVTHARLMEMTSVHSRDVTLALSALVKAGFLESEGIGKGLIYFFPDKRPEYRQDSDGFALNLESSSDCLDVNSDHLESSSDHLESSSDRLESSSDRWEVLMKISENVRGKKKAIKEDVRNVILGLCQDGFLTQRELSTLLGRSPHTLRNSYLKEMIQSYQLELRYPQVINHPHQAYRSRREKFS